MRLPNQCVETIQQHFTRRRFKATTRYLFETVCVLSIDLARLLSHSVQP